MTAKRKIAVKEPPKKSFRALTLKARRLLRNGKSRLRPSSPKSS
jgi:hypothetical protein